MARKKYKSRRLEVAKQVGKLEEEYGFCRRCMEIKLAYKFHKAVDLDIDKNGLFSVCKDCMDELCDKYINEEGSVQKAILKMCRTFNVAYNELAIDSALKQVESKNSPIYKVFGLYRAKLLVQLRKDLTDTASDVDMTYKDDPVVTIPESGDMYQDYSELELFWNTNDKEKIAFLEREFANFKKTHKADTHAEVVLLKEVCYKMWSIEQERGSGSARESSIKQLMDIMKNLAISPAMQNAASSGKSKDTFGSWIKDIENTTPAEWVKDKNAFKDVDGVEKYIDIIISSIRSFIVGKREFSIEDISSETGDVEPDMEEEEGL